MPFRALPPLRQRSSGTARAVRQGVATILAPETVSFTKLWAGCQLLAASSWHRGWFTSTRSVTEKLRSASQRRHTAHFRLHPLTHPGNRVARTREVHKMHSLPGTVCLTSTQPPEQLGPGKGTKCTAYLSLCPHGAPKNVRCGKCKKCRTHLGQHPCRAAWSLSSVEVHATLGCDKPSVVHPLHAPRTHNSSICLKCLSLPTAQQDKWA